MIVMQESQLSLTEIVLVGSRNRNRTVINTPVPIDVIDVQSLSNNIPQTTVNEILNYVAPSFTSQPQTVSDGTDHLDPASLRGLGPDQILVLINGKRRHTSALINVNETVGAGSVGTDLNSLPTAAKQRMSLDQNAISGKIVRVRHKQVLLDHHVAELYGVPTQEVNRAEYQINIEC